MNQDQFIKTIASVRPQATFLTLHGYKASSGEVADHQIIFHVSYEALLKRSEDALQEMQFFTEPETKAKETILRSIAKSLAGLKPQIEEIDGAYERFFDDEGKHIRGIKRHIESGVMHLYGVTVQKRIHVPGEFKEVKSKPETIVKNRILNLLPMSKWRQYRLTHDQVSHVTVDKREILPPDWRE
jgi:hypothetical protein